MQFTQIRVWYIEAHYIQLIAPFIHACDEQFFIFRDFLSLVPLLSGHFAGMHLVSHSHERNHYCNVCIWYVNGCSCCRCCNFVAIIILVSQWFFFLRNNCACMRWVCVYVCAVHCTQNQMVVIYTCLCSSLSPPFNYYYYYFAKSLKSTPFNTHSDSINCRTNDLWPFCIRCTILSVLAQTNSCQFFCLLSYRILFHCPLQRESFKFFSPLFYCIVSFSPSFHQIKWAFYCECCEHTHIFKMLIYFTVAQTRSKVIRKLCTLTRFHSANPFHFFFHILWVLLFSVVWCSSKLHARTKRFFEIGNWISCHWRFIDKKCDCMHCLIV